MYRLLQRQEVLYGHYAEAVQLVDEVNELLRARGLAEFTPWAPTVGKGNELVLMSEYPDLAAFQRESEAFYADAEIMKVWKSGSPLIVQGSVYAEILEPVPHMA